MKRFIKSVGFLILVGVVTLGFLAQSHAALDISGWTDGKIGGVITGDQTFPEGSVFQALDNKFQYTPFFPVVPSVDGMKLTVTGSGTGLAGTTINYMLWAFDGSFFIRMILLYGNTNVAGTTKDNGDGTFTWTTPLSGVHGDAALQEIIDVNVIGAGSSLRITRIAVEKADSTPPVVEITHPKDGEFAAAALNVSGISIDDVDGPLPVKISINDVVLTPDAYGNFGGQIVGPSTGNITINAEAVDSSGNVGTDSVTILRVHDNRK